MLEEIGNSIWMAEGEIAQFLWLSLPDPRCYSETQRRETMGVVAHRVRHLTYVPKSANWAPSRTS